MKRNLLIVAVAFVVTFTAVFAIRASTDALAVVIGVVLGVAASVPTTFLTTYFLTRQRTQDNTPQLSAQPPVVVINAQDKPAISAPSALPAPFSAAAQSRRWTVIGDTETES